MFPWMYQKMDFMIYQDISKNIDGNFDKKNIGKRNFEEKF